MNLSDNKPGRAFQNRTLLRLSIPFGVLYLIALGLGVRRSGPEVALLVALVTGILGLAGMSIAAFTSLLDFESNAISRRRIAGVGEGAFGLAVLVSALYWYRTNVFGVFVFAALLALALSQIGSSLGVVGRFSPDE